MAVVARYVAKRGTTSFTLVEHLPCVDQFVSRQALTTCERLPAEVTHVWPESTVCPAVPRQISKPSKTLATVVTPEGPFSRMSSVMKSQMTSMVRGVFAPLTLVSAVPADVAVTLLNVLLQTILRQTGIVAVGAVDHAFTWGAQEYSVAASSRAILTEFG